MVKISKTNYSKEMNLNQKTEKKNIEKMQMQTFWKDIVKALVQGWQWLMQKTTLRFNRKYH